MYIRVSEIPRDGFDVVARRGTAWVDRVLEGMDPHPLRTCRMVSATLFLKLEKRDIFASGSFVAEGEAECDRCTDVFPVRLEKEFHAVLVPKGEAPAGSANVQLHDEDLEIGFYDGTGVEVADVFWEQVALELPLKVLCREECQGVCPRCGGNRNRGECVCPGERPAGPFDALEKLRTETEKE